MEFEEWWSNHPIEKKEGASPALKLAFKEVAQAAWEFVLYSNRASEPSVEDGAAISAGCLKCGCPGQGLHYEFCPELKPPPA